MKVLIFITTLALFTACDLHHGHDNTEHDETKATEKFEPTHSDSVVTFPTIGYVKTHEEIIEFPVEQVFPLFEPQGRVLLYDNWNPTILKEGDNGTLTGMVIYSKYDNLDVMLTVREYHPEKGHIQYLVVWDDFEIQRIDIYCTSIENGNSTNVKWVEHNAGLYEKGIPLVKMFVEEGFLVKAVQRYTTNVSEKLSHEK